MKILFIADSTSIHTQRWISHFRDKGHAISIITLGKKTHRIDGVDHLANFDKFYYDSPAFLAILRKTRKIVNSLKPDILHGHFIHQYGWLAALSGYHPLVLTAWGTDILNLPYASRLKLGKWLTRFALQKADIVTATSEYLKQEVSRLGVDFEKIQVIFWGVDTEVFRPNVNTEYLRNRLGINHRQPVVLSNRNQLPLYNNDIVLRAMIRVLNRFPDAVLILQNSGGYLEAHLQGLADSLGISSSVRFLPFFAHQELPPLYAMADVYVSVPSWDAGPVSLKEAMACGCVPIISDVPGPMEWVVDGENGRVVPVRNINVLADAICELIEDIEKRQKYSKKSREMIEMKAGTTLMFDIMETIYFQLAMKTKPLVFN